MRLETLKIDDIHLCEQAAGRHDAIERMFTTLACWRNRSRQRTKLAELSYTERKDIGVTEADVWREVRKRPWDR
jgi:uncharacterized protein YjiS (DUF1127 family)